MVVVVAHLRAERLEHRVGGARVAELVLCHRRRRDRRLEAGGADRPLGVAAPERGLVVRERADERHHARPGGGLPGGGGRGAHALIASLISARGTMIMWIQLCSS